MNEELECFSCGIQYAIEADEILIRDEIYPKFCPFCGASDRDRELDGMFDWDSDTD